MLHYGLLGPLEVSDENGTYTPTTPMVRRVLALLLSRANQILPTELLIDELWGETPPKSATTTTQTYVYQLRRLLNQHAEDGWLVTEPPGYQLRVDPGQIDVHRFEDLSRRGRQLLDEGRPEQACPLLRTALEMWRGEPLANTKVGTVLESYVVHLEEQRMRTIELRIEAEAQLGSYREVIADLRTLVAQNPLNEWLHGQLIRALTHVGRRSEALQAYQRLQAVLSEELGLDPAPELQHLHHELLALGTPPTRHSSPRQMALSGTRQPELGLRHTQV